jgi:hypothetical protein
LKVSQEGFNFSLMGEFDPASYAGKLMQGIKKTEASLLNGMPPRNYFLAGGAISDPKTSIRVISDLLDPVVKELATIEGAGKKITEVYESMKESMSAVESFSLGYAQPTGPIGQQGMVQVVEVFSGNSAKMAVGIRKYMENASEMMNLMPQAAGAKTSVDSKKETKTIDGVKLDQLTVKFEFDRANAATAQQAQMMDLMYGAGGINTYMGAVDEKTYVLVMGGDEDLLNSSVQAAKKHENALGALPHVKAVSGQLPKARSAEFYFFADNMVTTMLEFAGMMMGQPMPIKLPPNMPPIGFVFSPEGSALRLDVHVSGEFVEKSVAAGMQAAMMMQGGGGPARRGGGL